MSTKPPSPSTNPLVRAIQSLLRHLLTDTSGDYPWSVESMCTAKDGDRRPHLTASKTVSSETVTVSRTRGDIEIQQDARLCLHVFEAAEAHAVAGMCVHMSVRHVHVYGNTVQDVGPIGESRIVAPYPVLDWASVLYGAAEQIEHAVSTLHVASVRALSMLEVDEPVQDPNSEPLDGSVGSAQPAQDQAAP